ncbi:hypothetical protein EJB05_34331, partial [Eragrostis curvula]
MASPRPTAKQHLEVTMAPKISLKLLVETKSKKVLFAEAGKEFVDFVFSLLTLPIGAVAKLVSAGTMHGSVGRLYQSVDNISASYLLPGADKAELLQPGVLHPGARELLLLPQAARAGDSGEALPPHLPKFKLFTCAGQCVTVTMERGAACPQCKRAMATEMDFVLPSASSSAAGGPGLSRGGGAGAAADEEGGGYVKGLVTYMVTDGLEVTPMSAISSITMINKFSVGKDVELAEKYVAVGMDEVRLLVLNRLFQFVTSLFCCKLILLSDICMAMVVDQGLSLLRAALRSETVLSDVFLARKK